MRRMAFNINVFLVEGSDDDGDGFFIIIFLFTALRACILETARRLIVK